MSERMDEMKKDNKWTLIIISWVCFWGVVLAGVLGVIAWMIVN